jgi:selenocysteine lyase/cysteine desulfurase
MIGLFIAEEVESEGKNVIWNNFSCSAPAPVVALANTTTSASLMAETVKQNAKNEAIQLLITVMPNPSATIFTLKLQSKYNAPIQMRITDATGRAVESRANLVANSTIQVGANFMSGTYYAEFTQGNQRKVVQLIKVK